MTTVYDPKTSEAILDAIFDIQVSNNGYATFPLNEEVRQGVQAAGYTVIRSTDLHGRPCYKGFTPAAQKALASEAFGISTYKPVDIDHRVPAFDVEAAILSRNDDYLF